MSPNRTYLMLGAVVMLAMAGNLVVFLTMRNAEPEACAEQWQPREQLYPRMTCQEARAELDRVAKGELAPRAIVLRPMQLRIDAADVKGPATIICDGIPFDVMDAQQANPEGPIVYAEGPHAVLVEELREGSLRVSQYAICGNVVGRERRGDRRE